MQPTNRHSCGPEQKQTSPVVQESETNTPEENGKKTPMDYRYTEDSNRIKIGLEDS